MQRRDSLPASIEQKRGAISPLSPSTLRHTAHLLARTFEHVFFIFGAIFWDNYNFLLPLDRTFRKKLLLLLISVRNRYVRFDFLITRS